LAAHADASPFSVLAADIRLTEFGPVALPPQIKRSRVGQGTGSFAWIGP
jgi:hypothetical protein